MNAVLKKKINLLIHLALVDGELDIRELAFIYNVCIRNGIDLDTIGDLIEQREPLEDMTTMSTEARIDHITDCLVLTLIDGKVLPKETSFVMEIAKHLGIDQAAMESLVQNLGSELTATPDEIRSRVTKIIAG